MATTRRRAATAAAPSIAAAAREPRVGFVSLGCPKALVDSEQIVTQLRGEAGPRQVDGARTGLVHTLGGNTATVCVSLLGRE